MSLSKDVVIKLLGDASSAIAAQKAAADAADVSVGAYKRAERELAKQQASEKSINETRKKGMQEASQASLVMGAALLAGFGVAVNAAAQFDKAMSRVSAATMANSRDLATLRQAALDAGAATMYTASDAANAETELAKAGLSVKDILGGALVGSLNLAAAGQLDVGEAASIAATSLQQFHLAGDQASHVADLLSAGSNKALGSVEDLSNALKYVGPVAAGMGVSIDETVGTLASFAQAGIAGEQAGTSLRGVISSMASPSRQASNEMKTLGINVFDAQGNFVGLSGLAGQLHEKLSGLTEAQRSQALGMIFGNQQLTAARVLYSEGAAGVDDWTKKVNDSGYAAKQAAKLTDNLSGDIERLGGSLSTVLIKGGDGATSVLRFLTQAAEGSVNAFGELPGPLAAVGVGLAGITGVGAVVLGIVGSLVPKVQAAREALRGLGATGAALDSGLGKVGKVAGYTGAAIAGISLLAAAFDALHPPTQIVVADQAVLTQQLVALGDSAKKSGADLQGFNVGHLITQLETMDNTSFSAIESLGSLGKAASWAQGALGGMVMDKVVHAHDAFNQATQSIKDTDSALSSLASGGHAEVAAAATQKLLDAWQRAGGTATEFKNKFPDTVAALEQYSSASKTTVSDTGAITDGMGKAVTAADELKDAFDALNGVQLTQAQANIKWTTTINGIKVAADKGSKSLDLNTLAGAQNAQQFVDAAKQANEFSQAIADTHGIDAGRAALGRFRDALILQAEKAGFDKAAVKALVDQIFQVPKDTPTAISLHDHATPGIKQVNALLDSLNGKTAQTSVVNTVITRTVNQLINATPIYETGSGGNPIGLPPIPHRASGGPFGPETYMVGEKGPELIQFGGSGFVTPADLTRQAMAHLGTQRPASAGIPVGASAGGVGQVTVNLQDAVVTGRFEFGADGLVRLVDGRIQAQNDRAARDFRSART